MTTLASHRTERYSVAWFRRRFFEIAAALFIVYSILNVSDRVSYRERDLIPAEAWFTVNEIYVPDYKVGSNPALIYDRIVKEPFQGFWIAEVQREEPNGLFSPACSGSGISDYEPSDYIPNNTVDWEWFIGRPCAVGPGTYRLRVSWYMKRIGWPEKLTVAYSNVFRVRP